MKLKVSDVYTQDVITITPAAPVAEARKLMEKYSIRRLPVVQEGKLLGIITLLDVMHAAPSPATSLSVWELNYLADKIKVEEVMTSDVYTAGPGMDMRSVATLMLQHKIGGVPVVDDGRLVGIVTESDVFRAFVELLQDEPGLQWVKPAAGGVAESVAESAAGDVAESVAESAAAI